MYMFIRHSTKRYGNNTDNPYRLDSDLNEAGIGLCKRRCKFFRKKSIKVIVCSPYLRARQTAEIISKELNIPIIISPSLSEYLGNQRDISDSDFRPETLAYDPIGIETYQEFVGRVEKVRTNIKLYYPTSALFITHGLVISTLLNIRNDEIKDCYLYEIKL